MTIKEIEVKGVLSRSKIYDYVVNPYVGCEHACVYCYARFIKRFTRHSEPWGRFVDVKVNAPEVLEKEQARKRKGTVWVSGVCDPYQPIEARYRVTRRCLEILQKGNLSVVIQTKSHLVLRDIDIFKHFPNIEVGLTITTASEGIRRIFEPGAPPIKKRLEALEALYNEGIVTYVMIAPVLPEAEELVDLLACKVHHVVIDKLNYHYADHVFKRFGLKKVEDVSSLASAFVARKIPCEVVC